MSLHQLTKVGLYNHTTIQEEKTVNVISPSTKCPWINIFVDPGKTFQSTN